MRAALDRVYPRWDGLAVAGRTDAGVHALGQVASFEADGGPPPERAAHALNGVLPDDVAVVASEEAPEGFSARFSATGRSYRYRIWRREAHSPLELRRSLWWPRPCRRGRARGLGRAAGRRARLQGLHAHRDAARLLRPHRARSGLVARRARPVVHDHRGQLPAPHGAHAGRDDAGAGPRGDGAPARGPPAGRGGRDRAALGPLSRASAHYSDGAPARRSLAAGFCSTRCREHPVAELFSIA